MTATGRVVLGLGARAGVPDDELAVAIDAVLAAAGLRPADVGALATLDRRATETGVRGAADRHRWPIVAFAAGDLAGLDVPHPSGVVARRTGTASVAEAAALLAAGPGATLIVPKRVFRRATLALARGRPDPPVVSVRPAARDTPPAKDFRPGAQGFAPKSTSLVSTVPAVRPGARW